MIMTALFSLGCRCTAGPNHAEPSLQRTRPPFLRFGIAINGKACASIGYVLGDVTLSSYKLGLSVSHPIMADDNKIFETCVVAFVDILGFKAHVKSMSVNNDFALKFLSILNQLKNIGSIPSDIFEGMEITVFSDSIVISKPKAFAWAEYDMALAANFLSGQLLLQGVLCRVGIARGELYHKSGIVLGNALIRAYEIESTIAVYPRIVFDNPVSAYVTAIPGAVRNYVIMRDVDGFWYANLFAQMRKLNSDNDVIGANQKRTQLFFDAICEYSDHYSDNLSIQGKWSWVNQKFEEMCDYLDTNIKYFT